MIATLDDDQYIALKVLAGDEPGRCRTILEAADAESAALPGRVARETLVLTDDRTIGRFDRAGISGQPGFQEFAERAFTDEADAGGVALVMDPQSALAGERAHLRLLQSSDWKVAAGEFRGRDHVQEIALVLASVGGPQQASAGTDARVMPGRKSFGPQAARIGEAQAELDLAVAEHVGIRRAPGAQLREEMGEDTLPVFRREADAMQRDAELGATCARVLEVGGSRAVTLAVVLPVRHEEALDIVAGIDQQRSRDRGIDAARHRDDVARHGGQPSAAGGAAPST